MVLWHSCALSFLKHTTCMGVSIRGVAFHFRENLPSRQIIPFPSPVLSFTHRSFVLDLGSCGKTALLTGEVRAAGGELPQHQSSLQ